MGRFDRYLFRQLMTLFGFFSLVLILLYWVNSAVGLFDELIGDGQSALVFLEFSALSLPGIIRFVVPLSAFVAALYVTNRLSRESELVVVQATGFSAWRLARAVGAFGLVVMLLMASLTHVLYPAAQAKLSEREDEIARNVTARLLNPGEFLTPAEGVTVYIREIDETGALRDLFLADTRDPDSQVIYTAATAYLVRTDRGPQLVMIDGLAQTLRTSDQRLFTTRFSDFTYDLARLIRFDGGGRLRRGHLPSWHLVAPDAALLEATGDSAERFRTELHERTNRAGMALVAALLGFSALLVGPFSRFGVGRQVVLAVVLIVIVNSVDALADRLLSMSPGAWPAAYLPTATGLGLSALFLTLATHPEWGPWRWRRRATA
ncbi:LPS export ABC transporter permease LptF [Histidinibacterium lentulum]|uniref:LPS export ABC transporter permease LptF n=1 Tax=Histidinibacterium lentulum TaxID=2480588 RepID=A0A3N2QTD0_9RHOB|nr:LPS export ABC transporter permease LptF [Histidinibacterium lentulum]ROT98454.1 LPS export ABC transporter permease LptF [Histidinibacterium lentulum]